MFDSQGNSKICDFGECLKISDHSIAYVNLKKYYNSPESFRDKTLYYAQDFWHLGICIFAMLTGDYPFQTKESVLNDQLPDMNEVRLLKLDEFKISNESYQIVTKLLNKDHKQRLASVGVKMEPFYKDFDWIKLENGTLEPPIKPKLVIIIYLLKTF